MHLSARPATPADERFLSDLFDAVRRPMFAGLPDEVVRPLLRQQHDAQRQGHAAGHPGADEAIVELDGRPVGRWLVDRRPDVITLVDVAIDPDHQGHGIGSWLLAGLIEESEQAHVPIRLSVASDNRARDLYERNGFRCLTTEGAYDQMERTTTAGHQDASPGTTEKDAT